MVNGTPYCPKRGDLVWMVFDPRVGHEQSGLRPAMVVSPTVYNERTGLCIVVPVTSNAKGYPFEVMLPEGQPVVGVILSGSRQVRPSPLNTLGSNPQV